jgi:uncharacterized membrane protein
VIRFGLLFNLYYDVLIFQVIWVIGASMVVLAALVFLPSRVVLIIGLVLVFGHNAFDAVRLKPGDDGFLAWIFLRQSGFAPVSKETSFFIPYALIPWLGIMLTGYGLGSLYTNAFDANRRRKYLLIAGLSAVALFIVLRAINIYGDPAPWSVQKNTMFTIMSFLNCTKYPVSLLYTLMTIGPVLIILAWINGTRSKTLEPFVVIGRVPLFYYILHFYLIHATSLVIYMISRGIPFSSLDFHFAKGFGGLPPGAGFPLVWTYVAWIAIVVALYPVCKWFNRYKSTHKDWWLSYL